MLRILVSPIILSSWAQQISATLLNQCPTHPHLIGDDQQNITAAPNDKPDAVPKTELSCECLGGTQ